MSQVEPVTPPFAHSPSARALWLMRALALAAAAVSGYLLSVSLSQWGLPAGCGAGSGCAAVLTSRWSSIFGVPVSALAVVADLLVFVTSFFVGAGSRPLARELASSLLLLLGAAICAAAAWFIVVQVFILQAVCPWCMGDHALGLALAGVIFYQVRRDLPPALLGVVLVVGLAGGQYLFAPTGPKVLRLPPGVNADSGPGPERRISVLDGKLELPAHELPVLGSADAPKLLVILFDYCCPHCRATHGYLVDGERRYPGQFATMLLPMPLNANCNPTVKETEPRFESSCDLARLSLAVWRAKPDAFGKYDAWLFEPETPRTAAEARAFAETLVPAAELDKALKDPWIEAQIAAHIKAYTASGVERIPVIMSPGFASIVGRPADEQTLFELLEKELGLKSAAEQRAP